MKLVFPPSRVRKEMQGQLTTFWKFSGVARLTTHSDELYKGGHMSIGKTRGFLYWLNRLLGDVRLGRDKAA
ncbi:MAG: hypothetical protein WBC82_00540 [Dehalococcoidia bacterium]